MKIIKLKTFDKPDDLIDFINENNIQRADIHHIDIVHGLNKMCSLTYWAFQGGGIVSGPTTGFSGYEGPEAVFPLDKLKQFIKIDRE